MILTEFFSLVTEMSINSNDMTGFVIPKKQQDIDNLVEWAETSAEFELSGNDLQIGQKYAFTLSPQLQDGLGYTSYQQYFDKKQKWWLSPSFDNVVEHQWLLYKSSDRYIALEHLEKVSVLLKLLTDKKRFYTTNNNIIVFFSKKPSELSLKAQNCTSLAELIRNLNKEQIQAIDDLCEWFGAETENEHFHSKKNAFSTALTDYLTEKEGRIQHDICDLLEDIVNIKNQALMQHDLYLEDFSYGKFVKKIEESASKFTTRINDSLGKSVTQVLGLPVATAVFNLAKIDLHWGSSISLMVYTLLCAVVLWNQEYNLLHIEKEFQLFEKTLPKQLKNDLWIANKDAVAQQIKNQKLLTKFLWCIIICTFWYSSYLIGYLLAITDIQWLKIIYSIIHI